MTTIQTKAEANALGADSYNITPGYARPPYSVENFPIGACVCNADGFNCFQAVHAPGAKFTSPEIAQRLTEQWNRAELDIGGAK